MNQFDELGEIKRILTGENSERLEELRKRIEDIDSRTRDVAEVLSPAIEVKVNEGGDLIKVLERPVSESLKNTIRQDPNSYAEILYPVMGPSIRRAISQAISSLLLTINKKMDLASSVKNIALRYKSIRSGVPYAELALRKFLRYKVEHVLLIDRDTGLLLCDVSQESDAAREADAISAMFTAIQSFVQDSFSQNKEDRLTDLKVGGHNVWVVHGRKIMLACVIYGEAPETLKTKLYDVLDEVSTQYALQISHFDGRTSDFKGIDQYLKPLLHIELKSDDDKDVKKTKNSKVVFFCVLLALGACLLIGGKWLKSRIQLDTIHYYLQNTPGIVVSYLDWDSGKVKVQGFQDPDADIPYAVFDEYGIKKEQLLLDMVPFRSLEAEMEGIRFLKEFDLPKGVELVYENGVISLRGKAPIQWLFEHDLRLTTLSLDKRININLLYASDESIDDYVRQYLHSEPDFKTENFIRQFKGVPWGKKKRINWLSN